MRTVYSRGACFGFRKWEITNNCMLKAVARNFVWDPGVNYAECSYCGDQVPSAGCDCGFNAWFDLDDAEKAYSGITGFVAGSGNVQVHKKGFRSSEVQIIALLAKEGGSVRRSRYRGLSQEDVDTLAENYGVPVFDDEEKFVAFCKSVYEKQENKKKEQSWASRVVLRAKSPARRAKRKTVLWIKKNIRKMRYWA